MPISCNTLLAACNRNIAKEPLSGDEELLGSYSILNGVGDVIASKLEDIKLIQSKNPAAMIELNDDNELFDPSQPKKHKTVEPETVSTGTGGPKTDAASNPLPDTPLTGSAFVEEIKYTTIQLDPSKIKAELETFCKEVKRESGYSRGELKIIQMKDSAPTMKNLVAAGTKVLDASIYSCNFEDPNIKDIFEVQIITEISLRTASENLQSGKNAIISAVLIVFNRGGLPSKDYTEATRRPLQEMVKKTIWDGKMGFEDEVANILSSGSLSKFPGKVFLKIDMTVFDAMVGQRARLSVAGNKHVRLAMLASGFEESRVLTREQVLALADPVKGFQDQTVILHCKEIVNYLKSISANTSVQLAFHPLADDRNVTPGFTGTMVKAILLSLSARGRKAFTDKIQEKQMSTYTRDPLLMGSRDAEGNQTWPILVNNDYNPLSFTIAGIKAMYKHV